VEKGLSVLDRPLHRLYWRSTYNIITGAITGTAGSTENEEA
jgi:hypothetical protein